MLYLGVPNFFNYVKRTKVVTHSYSTNVSFCSQYIKVSQFFPFSVNVNPNWRHKLWKPTKVLLRFKGRRYLSQPWDKTIWERYLNKLKHSLQKSYFAKQFTIVVWRNVPASQVAQRISSENKMFFANFGRNGPLHEMKCMQGILHVMLIFLWKQPQEGPITLGCYRRAGGLVVQWIDLKAKISASFNDRPHEIVFGFQTLFRVTVFGRDFLLFHPIGSIIQF